MLKRSLFLYTNEFLFEMSSMHKTLSQKLANLTIVLISFDLMFKNNFLGVKHKRQIFNIRTRLINRRNILVKNKVLFWNDSKIHLNVSEGFRKVLCPLIRVRHRFTFFNFRSLDGKLFEILK